MILGGCNYIVYKSLKHLYLFKKYYKIDYKSFYGITYYSNFNRNQILPAYAAHYPINKLFWFYKIIGSSYLFIMMHHMHLISK